MLTQTLLASSGATGFSKLITGLRLAADTVRHCLYLLRFSWRHEVVHDVVGSDSQDFPDLAKPVRRHVTLSRARARSSVLGYAVGLRLFLEAGRGDFAISKLATQEGYGLVDPLWLLLLMANRLCALGRCLIGSAARWGT